MRSVSYNSGQILVANIQVQRAGDRPLIYQLDDNASMIVGRDQVCGLRLEDESVSSKHCILRMADGQVHVSDWYSENGTIVNGAKIGEEVTLGPADRLVVGIYTLRFSVTTRMNAENAFEIAGQSSVDEQTTQCDSPDLSPLQETPLDPTAATEPEQMGEEPFVDEQLDQLPPCPQSESPQRHYHDPQSHDPQSHDPQLPHCQPHDLPADGPSTGGGPDSPANQSLSQQLAAALDENEQLKLALEYQLSLNGMDPPDLADYQSMDDGENELLRAEVEHLQAELAQRESELQQLLEVDYQDGDYDQPVAESTETSRLVERLEELLDELQTADSRILNLEDLLRASDEANQAEREERRQLETWVSEIESRIAEREQEWQLREDAAKKQLDEANSRRAHAENSLSQLLNGRDNEAQRNAERQISQLRDQNQQLKSQLESAHQQLANCQQSAEESGFDPQQAAAQKARQQEMRQHELEIAKERAEIARQRAELSKIKDEIDRSERQEPSAENPDVRLRAFREHLKEIHEKEQQEKRERSLSSRISKIWQRLEGR